MLNEFSCMFPSMLFWGAKVKPYEILKLLQTKSPMSGFEELRCHSLKPLSEEVVPKSIRKRWAHGQEQQASAKYMKVPKQVVLETTSIHFEVTFW